MTNSLDEKYRQYHAGTLPPEVFLTELETICKEVKLKIDLELFLHNTPPAAMTSSVHNIYLYCKHGLTATCLSSKIAANAPDHIPPALCERVHELAHISKQASDNTPASYSSKYINECDHYRPSPC